MTEYLILFPDNGIVRFILHTFRAHLNSTEYKASTHPIINVHQTKPSELQPESTESHADLFCPSINHNHKK